MAVKLDLKNALINGDFSYFQRGTSFAAVASLTYTADRWRYDKAGTMVHTVSRSSDVPSSAFGIYSALIDCTTAQVSLGNNDNTHFIQRIEGNMFRPLKGKKIVFSFWVKATKTGTYCVAFRNASSTRSLVKEYSVSAANTWEKKIIRFEHDPSGSWNYDNSLGMDVVFTIACGTTLQTTPNSWQSGDYLATANQVNACDNVANNFQLADVCLQEDNEGQTRTPDFQLAGRDIFEELQLCQRYFEKSYSLDVDPGAIDSNGSIRFVLSGSTTDVVNMTTQFKQSKRVIPGVSFYNPTTGAVNGYRNESAATNGTIASTRVSTEAFSGNNSTSASSGNRVSYQWTADAEL